MLVPASRLELPGLRGAPQLPSAGVFGNCPRQVRSASLLSCLQAVLVHGGDMAVLRRHRLADVVLAAFFLVSRRAQVLVRSGLVPVGGPAGWRGARRRSG
jgi:hypothetical protein